jgi:hypothetical protein
MKHTLKKTTMVILAFFISGCGDGGGISSGTSNNTDWARQVENPLIVPNLTATTLDFGPADPTVLFDPEDSKWKIWFSSTLKDIASGSETMTIKYSESLNEKKWVTS